MRIISLLPSATAILEALGASDQIVGSENIIKTKIKNSWSSSYINLTVSDSLHSGKSIYTIDNKKFIKLKADLVITQQLCNVCSITPTDLQTAIRDSKPIPNIISLHPHTISEILEDILEVGTAIGKRKKAESLVLKLKVRINNVKNKLKKIKTKPKVYCMEWLDPPYSGGHWVKEQVEIAGGKDQLANKGDSKRILWKNIIEYNPDFLILMPCGFSIERTKRELNVLRKKLAKFKRVYIVNGPKYFNSSGPEVVTGIELLASILHPKIFKDFSKKFSTQDVQMIKVN